MTTSYKQNNKLNNYIIIIKLIIKTIFVSLIFTGSTYAVDNEINDLLVSV